MAFAFNPFTGTLDIACNPMFQGASASAPSDPVDGWTFINTSTNELWVYAGGQWWVLQSVTPVATVDSFFLLETGDKLLLETGDDLLLQV